MGWVCLLEVGFLLGGKTRGSKRDLSLRVLRLEWRRLAEASCPHEESGERLLASLAVGFVEDDRGGGGGVQGFYLGGHGDVNAGVGGVDYVFG